MKITKEWMSQEEIHKLVLNGKGNGHRGFFQGLR